MKQLIGVPIVCLLLCTSLWGQTTEVDIIPKPQSVERGDGVFRLDRRTNIVAADDWERKMAKFLRSILEKDHKLKLKITAKPQTRNAIVFTSAPDADGVSGSYTLNIDRNLLRISGGEQGMFYAVQSLRQLLPVSFPQNAAIQAIRIEDRPRFSYRGMHLDVGRHFFPVSFIKRYIDLISQYKFNYFHWHLTEDQGWRIEIKKYPRLTEIGSTRPESFGDGVPHEGFYTQEEIRDVVEYAKARYVTIIPEIEMPGHASAALAAYPELGCKEGFPYKVQTKECVCREIMCPTEKTFQFLEDVLTEVAELFSNSPYIHIGGDEVPKQHWKESAFVQELKQRENLRDEYEVQSYFIRRIEKIVNAKGKKIIGWDEILDGGLAPNATVMSWRGMKGGIQAAKAKHQVIMTPTEFAYFNFGQGDVESGRTSAVTTMGKAYAFEPVPPELTPNEARYIIGGQANVWTEYIKTPARVEYMTFPRILAISEVLWSMKEGRDFDDFRRRLARAVPRLDKQRINYRIPEPSGLRNIITDEEKVSVTLESLPGTWIHYTTDGTEPNEKSSVYSGPIDFQLERGVVRSLRLIVLNADGRKSLPYGATIIRDTMREPVQLNETKRGAKYELVVPNGKDKARHTGETNSILLDQFQNTIDLKKPFTVSFEGYFRAPVDGLYEFELDSSDSAHLEVGGDAIIDHTGVTDYTARSATVPLKAGLHKVTLRYSNRGGDPIFRLWRGVRRQGVAANMVQSRGNEFVH